MYLKFKAHEADEKFESLPEPGEEIEHNGDTHIIVTVEIVNQSGLMLCTELKKDVKYVSDDWHASTDWEELPDRFLETGPSNDFLDVESLKQT